MPLGDALLILGATLRLTRLITTDDLGAWWIREPAYRAAVRHMARTGNPPWWDRYRAGLECKWCCGFWIGTAVLTTYALSGQTHPWRFAASALTLSHAVGILPARLDAVPGAGDAAS